MKRALGLLVALAALRATPALAGEQVVEVDGAAATTAADPKVAARDDAFAAAVQAALPALVPAEVLTARRADIARDIVGRARRFVARYSVTSERDDGGVHAVHAAVTVDLGKVVEALRALGIAEAAEPAPAVAPPAPRGAPRATLLMRVITPAGVAASYGPLASRLDSAGAIEAELVRRGWKVVAPPASGPAAGPAGELPLELDAARALAGDSRAALAVVVGVSAAEPGRVRGVPGVAVAARAWAVVVDVATERTLAPLASAVGSAAGAAGDALTTAAVTAAAQAALADAAPLARSRSAPSAAAATDVPVAAGEVRVTLRGRSWTGVRAVRAALAARKDAVVDVRRVTGDALVLVVRSSDAVAALSRAIKAVAGVQRVSVDGEAGLTVELVEP